MFSRMNKQENNIQSRKNALVAYLLSHIINIKHIEKVDNTKINRLIYLLWLEYAQLYPENTIPQTSPMRILEFYNYELGPVELSVSDNLDEIKRTLATVGIPRFKEIGFNNIEGIIYKVIIILLELGCCIGLINLIPKRKTIFCRLGENSITIYGFHAAIVYVITYFIKDVPPYKGLIYILILGLTIGLTFVLSSKPIQELYKILMKPYKKISEDGDAK